LEVIINYNILNSTIYNLSFISAFGQPQQQQQQTSLFGQTQNPPTSSVFGTQQTSLFGASKPTGFAFSQQSMQQPTNTMFSSQPQPTQGSFFGQPQTSTGGVFGSSATSTFGAAPTTAFGQSTSTQGLGTSIAKFNPPQESETMQKGSSTSYVQTKQQCVTFMKEYADKSLEELRIEDYAANRKGPQAGSTMFSQPTGGVFGSTATQPAGGSLFGATQTAPQTGGMFGGGATFGQQTSTFGQTNTMFGKPLTAPASTTAPSFGGFGATNTSTFGAAKPFGAPTTSTGLFGQSQPSTFGATTNTFGQTQNTFGAAPQQSGSLFGSTATATAAPFGGLGTSQPSTAFNFSQPNNTSAGQPGSLFGAAAKPTGFGTSTFGAPTSQPASTFTGFSSQPTAGTSLFNQPKPFSFGQSQPAATPAVSFGGTGGSLFGNTSTQQTGGLFGNTSTLNTGGGGLFGSSQPSAFGATQGGGLSFGLQQSSGGLFG
jgi:nuclear pore complex protein Nup98-Nup96